MQTTQIRATLRLMNRQLEAIDSRVARADRADGAVVTFSPKQTGFNARLAQRGDGSLEPVKDFSSSKFQPGRSAYLYGAVALTKVGAAV